MTSTQAMTRRWPRIVAIAVASVTGLAIAQEQEQGGRVTSETPSVVDADSTPTTRPARSRRLNPALMADTPDEEEWRAALEFMSRYSPNRVKAMEEQAITDSRHAGLRRAMYMHYRDLTLARERGDEDLFNLKTDILGKEDEVWALQRQMREAPDPERPVLHWQLRQKLAELVRMGLKERELRIARLEKSLAEEKARLAADHENVEQRISERIRSMTAGLRSRPPRPRDDSPATPATTSQTR